MAIVICTLFEKDYHFGLAALVNSAYKNGYRGEIYVGYKGAVPPWASVKENPELGWVGATTFELNQEITLHFLPIDTEFHLANYKPTFMLFLFEKINRDIGGVIYFDPDIVIKCKWTFYETWMSYGVSLVHEIISNDMPSSHPIRKGWEQVVFKSNRKITHNIGSYINSGFCAVLRKNIEFVNVWKDIIKVASEHYALNVNQFAHSKDRSNLFFAHDQDALNIAAMCCESPISEMGPEGMDFIGGGFTMSHAIGTPKPWQKNYMTSAFRGNAPGIADREFWLNVKSPVNCYGDGYIKLKQLSIKTAALIGRFYKRN
ncbi:MAG: hypothetical protein JWR09_220 [Mucilaginibacter sp.]|nr:hypothetical protein [Mucilaginibacter sp.]